jgi:hypothetical protein
MNLKASLFLFLFSIHNKLKSISAHTYNFILLAKKKRNIFNKLPFDTLFLSLKKLISH